MRQDDRLASLVIAAQQRIFRLAARDHGLSLKTISADSGIHYDTLRAYAVRDNTAMMPVAAILKLIDVIPDYLLSQLFDPVGRRLEVVENGDGDLDELGREAAGFVHEFVEAKSDGRVTPIEHARLSERASRVAAAAGKVRAA